MNIKENQIFDVEILEITYKGKGVCKIDAFVIFLNSGVPGDKVQIKITKLKKKYGEGEILALLEPSKNRIEPLCSYFETCGGCQLQNINYPGQLKYKESMVYASLKHIGKIKISINPIIPSPLYFGYRNQLKIKIQIGKNTKMGFYQMETHEIVEINKCILGTELCNNILKEVKFFLQTIQNTSLINCDGACNLFIRVSHDQKNAILIFADEKKAPPISLEIIEKISAHLINKFTEIQCIIKQSYSQGYKILIGNDNFSYLIKDINFQISSLNFWQVNFTQFDNLVDIVLNFAELTGNEIVLDAYCGSGFFSLFLARKSRFVYGIELNPGAIKDAKKNALLNNIYNVKFIAGDVEKNILNHLNMHIDLILVDPPRNGCSPLTLTTILKISPEKIIYVSCNPSTLARDLQVLCDNGYSIANIQPIDMFPQTYHIECIVSLGSER